MVIVGNELPQEEKEKIKSKIIDHLQEEGKVIFAYLHGSFIEGEFNDIDIAVYISENVDNKDMVDFELRKEVEISRSVGYEVDLRALNLAPNSFCYSVIKDGELLFSFDDSGRSDFESLVLVKHHDFKRFRKRYRKQAIGV